MRYSGIFLALTVVGFSACAGDNTPAPEGEGVGGVVDETAGIATAPGMDGPLGAVPIPAGNPLTPAKVALGHQLFFDARLSVDGSRSCYSCHQNEDGNGGAEAKAVGAANRQLTRHSPVIWNVAYMPRFYWDGWSVCL